MFKVVQSSKLELWHLCVVARGYSWRGSNAWPCPPPLSLSCQQASECLQEHVQRVGVENVRLRAELQQLMATTSDLRLQKGRLEQQHRALLREERLGQELQRVGRAPGGVFRRRLEPPVGEAVEEFEGRTSLPEIRMPYSSSR